MKKIRHTNSHVCGEHVASKATTATTASKGARRVPAKGPCAAPAHRQIKLALDVHADTIVAVRMVDGARPQPPQTFKSQAFLDWVVRQKALAQEVVSCYEAGPTGFWLHRQLEALGVRNVVICPMRLDERHRGVANDRTDALELATRLDRYLAGNPRALGPVRVPSEAEEQRRSRPRQRGQLCKQRLSIAAQGRSLMLVNGRRESNSWWTARRWEPLRAQLPAWLAERLEVWHRVLLELNKEIVRLTAEVEAQAPAQRPRGLGALSHEVIESEVADWGRFKNRRQVGSYAGLTGGVSSSGQSHADLSITKAGNPRLRTALVEASWRLVLQQPGYYLVRKWKGILLNPKAHARARKRAIIAFARQLFIDLWRWKTGRRTPEQLGWVMTAAA